MELRQYRVWKLSLRFLLLASEAIHHMKDSQIVSYKYSRLDRQEAKKNRSINMLVIIRESTVAT